MWSEQENPVQWMDDDDHAYDDDYSTHGSSDWVSIGKCTISEEQLVLSSPQYSA